MSQRTVTVQLRLEVVGLAMAPTVTLEMGGQALASSRVAVRRRTLIQETIVDAHRSLPRAASEVAAGLATTQAVAAVATRAAHPS